MIEYATIECSESTMECPAPWLWNMYDDQSAEIEVLDFLYQLVLTIKPTLVVETGTHLGHTAHRIANGIAKNKFGKLITCENNPELHKRSSESLKGWKDIVDCRPESSLELKIEQSIDLLFSDSDRTIRMKEIEYFWEKLSPSSIILIHDVNTGCHKPLREELLTWSNRLHIVFLPTPRGLAICQKKS